MNQPINIFKSPLQLATSVNQLIIIKFENIYTPNERNQFINMNISFLSWFCHFEFFDIDQHWVIDNLESTLLSSSRPSLRISKFLPKLFDHQCPLPEFDLFPHIDKSSVVVVVVVVALLGPPLHIFKFRDFVVSVFIFRLAIFSCHRDFTSTPPITNYIYDKTFLLP